MRALAASVAASIETDIADANGWTIENDPPMWRNPKKGRCLYVYWDRSRPGEPRWTGGTNDLVEVVLEYVEPTSSKQARLERDEIASEEADDVAAALRTWALAHEAGFSPAHKMDWAGTSPSPNVRPEMFVRYVRCLLVFEVAVSYG